jgi:hypothetical protein
LLALQAYFPEKSYAQGIDHIALMLMCLCSGSLLTEGRVVQCVSPIASKDDRDTVQQHEAPMRSIASLTESRGGNGIGAAKAGEAGDEVAFWLLTALLGQLRAADFYGKGTLFVEGMSGFKTQQRILVAVTVNHVLPSQVSRLVSVEQVEDALAVVGAFHHCHFSLKFIFTDAQSFFTCSWRQSGWQPCFSTRFPYTRA